MKRLILLPLCLLLTGFATSYNIVSKQAAPPTCDALVSAVEEAGKLFLEDLKGEYENIITATSEVSLKDCTKENEGIVLLILSIKEKKVVDEKEVLWCTKIGSKAKASLGKDGILTSLDVLEDPTFLINAVCK